MEDSEQHRPADLAVAAVDSLLRELHDLLHGGRDILNDDARHEVFLATRRQLANAIADAQWLLRGTLSTVDEIVFRALRRLEPIHGEEWRTTGAEIWNAADTNISLSVVYVALKRLAYIGLIDLETRHGSLVRIHWDRFGTLEPTEARA